MADITRVQYWERQFLGAADFRVEQSYHRDGGRRHAIGPHTWGIVVGLELLEVAVPGSADEVDVILQPGLATDGYGRELVAFAPLRLDAAAFERFVDDAHRQVWLAYDEDAFDGSGDNCEESSERRVSEGIRLVVDPTPPLHDEVLVDGVAGSVPPAPPGAPVLPVDESVPYQELPVAEAARWLVRLGDVRWDGSAGVFRPAAAGRLVQGRRYAGTVADHVLGAAGRLRVAPRVPAADPDADEFALVEGRVRVQGRINAERELWMEGEPVRFTYDGGSEEDVELTLGRVRSGSGAGHQLRVRLGDDAEADHRFVVGRAGGAPPGPAASDVLEVGADDVVHIPTGLLEFGADTRQMIDLWSSPGKHEYGIGVQSGTLYQRTANDVAWFRGGEHSDTALDPGDQGLLQMRLDADGRLHFGQNVRQMLNLWSTQYGIGVQSGTLYQRTAGDFCWFRGGAHANGASDPGGGSLVMRLDDTNKLTVFGTAATTGELTVGTNGDAVVRTRHVIGKQSGSDGLASLFLNWSNGRDVVVGAPGGVTSDLLVSGALRVYGNVDSVIHVWTTTRAVDNSGPGPVGWSVAIPAGEFSQVDTAFVVLQGFSLFPNDGNTAFDNWGHVETTGAIPQHVVVRVIGVPTTTNVSGICHCSESDVGIEGDNTVLFTVVVIGRRLT